MYMVYLDIPYMDPVGFIEVLISFYLSSLDCIDAWKGAMEVSSKFPFIFRELRSLLHDSQCKS